jgi:hypothetical protein
LSKAEEKALEKEEKAISKMDKKQSSDDEESSPGNSSNNGNSKNNLIYSLTVSAPSPVWPKFLLGPYSFFNHIQSIGFIKFTGINIKLTVTYK